MFQTNLLYVGFWMDVGQPKDFLLGSKLYLQFLRESFSDQLAVGNQFHGNVLVVRCYCILKRGTVVLKYSIYKFGF